MTDSFFMKILKLICLFFLVIALMVDLCCFGAIVFCSVKMDFKFVSCIKSICYQLTTEKTVTGENIDYFLYFLGILISAITLLYYMPPSFVIKEIKGFLKKL